MGVPTIGLGSYELAQQAQLRTPWLTSSTMEKVIAKASDVPMMV